MFVPFSVRMRRAGMKLQQPLGYSFSGPQWVPEEKVDMEKVDKVIAVLADFVGFWAANRSKVAGWIKQDLAERQARAARLLEFHTASVMDLNSFPVSWYDLNEEWEAIRCVEDAFMAAEWEAERAAAEAARREALARAELQAAQVAALAAEAQARKEAENERLLGLSDAAFGVICAQKLRICRGRGQDDALLLRWIRKMWDERARRAVEAAPQVILHNRQRPAAVRVARVVARAGHFAALDSDSE